MATKTINQFNAITSIDSADEILAWDASAGTTRKITFANFQTGYLTTTTGLQATGATTGATSQAQTFTNGMRVGDGAVGTPSISFSSDTNTGLYWIGADILGVAIGGSERLRVTTDGLTINSAQQQLYISVSGTQRFVQSSGATVTDYSQLSDGSADASFRYFRLTNTTGTKRVQYLAGDNSTTLVHQIGINTTTIFNEQGSDLDFRIEGDTDTALFFVDASTDRIGVGTSTPASKVQVLESNAATNAVFNMITLAGRSTGTAAAGFGAGLLAQLESSTTNDQSAGRLTWAWSTATHASRAAIGKLTAYYTSTEREAITWTATSAAALVGIMTASPQRTLDVNGTIRISGSDAVFTTANWAKFIEFNNGASFTWLKNGATYAHGFGGTDGGFYWFRSTADDGSAAPTYDMVLSDAGRLGLGTAGPQGLIHGHDGSGGFLFVNQSGVDGTLVTVIPNGTGDVTERLHMFGWVSNSVASFVAQVNETYLDVSTSTTKTDGSNTLTIAVAADGSFTLQATAGAATWKVLLWVFWR